MDIMESIEVIMVEDTFQRKLKGNIPKTEHSPNVFVFADTTSIIY